MMTNRGARWLVLVAGCSEPTEAPKLIETPRVVASDAAPPDAPPGMLCDLGGARARIGELPGWQLMAGGTDASSGWAFMRTPEAFITETLLIAPHCLDGPCETVDARMKQLGRWWKDSRSVYQGSWSLRPGRVERPDPRTAIVNVVMEPHSKDPKTVARVHVRVVHPEGARNALLCEVLIFGDDAALERASRACETIEILPP